MLPSSIHIMWPMHLRTLKLLCPMVQKKMHRKYIIWPWPQGQGHMNCCLVPSTSCDLCTGKIWSCYFQKFMRRCVYKKKHYLTFNLDLWVKVTQKVTQYPRHHVTYAQAKFEVATSKSLWGDAFTKKYIIWPWPWGQGHTKCHPVPSTSCDLCIYKVWSCYVQRFRRRYNYKKRDGQTDAQTDGRRTDFGTKLIYPIFLTKKRV